MRPAPRVVSLRWAGTCYPPTTTLSIDVNGQVLGTTVTNETESFIVILSTVAADPGLYRVTAVTTDTL